jgi:hypothetical protein
MHHLIIAAAAFLLLNWGINADTGSALELFKASLREASTCSTKALDRFADQTNEAAAQVAEAAFQACSQEWAKAATNLELVTNEQSTVPVPKSDRNQIWVQHYEMMHKDYVKRALLRVMERRATTPRQQ